MCLCDIVGIDVLRGPDLFTIAFQYGVVKGIDCVCAVSV